MAPVAEDDEAHYKLGLGFPSSAAAPHVCGAGDLGFGEDEGGGVGVPAAAADEPELVGGEAGEVIAGPRDGEVGEDGGRELSSAAPPSSLAVVVQRRAVGNGEANGSERVETEEVVEGDDAEAVAIGEVKAFEEEETRVENEAALVPGGGSGGEAKSRLGVLLGSLSLSRTLSVIGVPGLTPPSKPVHAHGANDRAKVGLGVVLDLTSTGNGAVDKRGMKDKDEALVGSGRQNIRSSVPSSLNRLDSSAAQGEVVAPACLQTCLVLGDAETEDVVTVNKGAARELTSSGASFSDAASRFKEIVGVDVVLAFPSGPGPLASADLLEKLAMEELGKVKLDNHVADGEEESADHCSRPEQRASEEVFDVDEQGNGAEWGGAKEELAVEDGEVVAQRVSTKQGATMVGPAMEEQMLVEQRVGDEWKATIEYPGAEEEALVEEGGGDKWGPTKGELSVEEQGKLVEQYVNEEWLTSKEGVDVKELEKAVEKSLGGKWKATKDELAVEGQEKVVEPGISEEWKATKDNVAVEDQEEVVEQSIGAGRELTKDELAVEDHASEVEQCIGDKCKVAKDELAAVDQGNVMEQCVSDEWKATKDDFDVEDQAEVVECVRHEWSATKDELTKEEVGAFGGIDDTLSSMVIPAMGNCRDEGIMKEKVKVRIAYPQRPGKLNCPSYMTTGTCMYGFSCHFDHPLLKARSGPPRFRSDQVKLGDLDYVELNRVGLPIRQGVRNCAYYMRNGTCRYGNKCCFNHPEKVVDAQLYPPTGWDDNASPCSQQSKGSCDHVALDDTVSSTEVLPPNIFIMLLPPQKPPPTAEEKETKAAESSSVSDDSDGCCSADSSDGPLCKQEQKEYPERPGRPECSFYVKYGNCKFASACNYHHPKGRLPSRWHSKEPLKSAGFHATSSTPREQEMMEYPERPGKQECPFYFAYRNCKFGSECYYHHPKDMPPSRWHPENPSKPVVFNELHSASNVALQDHMGQQEQYPQRPGEPECAFYLKSGKCKFGVECKYHHPKEPSPSRRHSPSPSKPVAFGEHHSATSLTQHDHMCLQEWYPERPGEQECWYYMHFGKCKYLSACKFHHPKDRVPSGRHSPGLSQLDMSGTWHFANASRSEDLCLQERTEYPEIPDVQDCPFYMKTGTCKFGLACKFNHPKVRVPSMEAATNDGFDLAYDNFTRSENIVHQHEQMVYPERPGEPECSFYMKHGLCKFQMNCRYHHPKDRLP